MKWILNLAYLAIVLLAAPVLLYRRIRHGKYRDGWSQKLFGHLPLPRTTDNGQRTNPRIWFHAVSVGEVLQLVTVVRELEEQCPQADIVITTTTSTGLAVAKEKFPQHHVCYYPLDFSWAVRNAVDRIRPDAVVLVELELWPNFIREVHSRGIPLLLINGRISEKSFRGYRKLRFLMRQLLPCVTHIAVQNENYADRLRNLGAPPERITVTGSIKFDSIQLRRDNPRTQELRQSFGLRNDETVFIAGSTHAPEEELALQSWRELQNKFPNLRLILVPRHKERFDEVAKLVEANGLPLLRRSSLKAEGGKRKTDNSDQQLFNPSPPPPNSSPVILLDTLGELSACWGLADVAFVGGSLTSRGGQNMIEPAGYGAAVLFGPNTRNFRDVVDLLLDGNAARVVADGNSLTASLRNLLQNPSTARQLGANAQKLVLTQQGATARTLTAIRNAVPGLSVPTAHPRAA